MPGRCRPTAGAAHPGASSWGVGSVSEIVAAELSRWGLSDVERAVFGSDDPNEIDRIVARFCDAHLGERPASGLFYRSSAGCVAGVGLASGRQVVLKAYQDRWTHPFLSAVRVVQEHLGALGYPCARPLGGPVPLRADRPNLVMVESWLPDPGMAAYRSAQSRRASAAGLARQIGLCRDLRGLRGLDRHPLRRPAVGLYPEPHSPLFDFGQDAESARWIDDFAERAVEVRDREQEHVTVVAHTDWSARNVRLHGGERRGGLRLGQRGKGAGEHGAGPGGRHLVRDVGTRWILVPVGRRGRGVPGGLRDGCRRLVDQARRSGPPARRRCGTWRTSPAVSTPWPRAAAPDPTSTGPVTACAPTARCSCT